MLLVHHLRIGRSVFTVWLLEELGLDYELKIYNRNEMGRAPPELKEAHPLGKSPVIEIDGITLSESGAIATYLLEKFDANNRLGADEGEAKKAEWLQWLHYTEGSAFAPLLIKLLLSREQSPSAPLVEGFSTKEVELHLGYIQDFLGDKPYLLGNTLKAPDFGMCFILSSAKQLGELGPYPKLEAYLERALSLESFKKAYAKTGG